MESTSSDTTGAAGLFCSSSTVYSVLELIGEGSYGKVTKCQDLTTNKIVAVKLVEKQPYANEEVRLLETIRALNPDRINVIRFIEWFEHMDMNCLVFEMLDKSLHDLVSEEMKPLRLDSIRAIAQQLFVALEALQVVGIVHGDIKPDNIMLVNVLDEPHRIKLIDFGLAMLSTDIHPGLVVQAVSYRAPEILLGMPFTEAIDVWGVGCVLAFLYLANHFFDVSTEYQMMKAIVELVGQPDDHLIRAGMYSYQYFMGEKVTHGPECKLMTSEEYAVINKVPYQYMGFNHIRSMDDLLHVHPIHGVADFVDSLAFVELMKQLLNPVGARRVSAHQALQDPFITMDHLMMYPAYLDNSQSIMSDFQLKVSEEPAVEQDARWTDGPSFTPPAQYLVSYGDGGDAWWSDGQTSSPTSSLAVEHLVSYGDGVDASWSHRQTPSPAVEYLISYGDGGDAWWSHEQTSSPAVDHLISYGDGGEVRWSHGQTSTRSASPQCFAVMEEQYQPMTPWVATDMEQPASDRSDFKRKRWARSESPVSHRKRRRHLSPLAMFNQT